MTTKEHLQIKLQTLVNSLFYTTKMDARYYDLDLRAVALRTGDGVPDTFALAREDLERIVAFVREEETACFHFVNALRLEYLAVGDHRAGDLAGILILGPFLSRMPDITFISDVVYNSRFTMADRPLIRQYYRSLSLLSNKEILSLSYLLSNTVGTHLIEPSVRVEDLSRPLDDQQAVQISMEENMDIVQSRYDHERQFMDAIARGNLDEVNALLKHSSIFFSLPDRVPGDPTRSFKNLLFVLNTLCRKAAQQGSVHPIYIHNLSEKYAIAIEKARSQYQLQRLANQIPMAYCRLVREHSTARYSPLIRRAVEYIHLHLESALSLSEIAESIPVNPSHLSRKFKAETGLTITEYINHQRIEEAKIHLRGEHMSISDIAYMVGYNNLNYFTRVFKKTTGLTPTEYSEGKEPVSN